MIKSPKNSLSTKILVAITSVILILFGGTLYYATGQTGQELQNIQADSGKHFGDFVYRALRLAMEEKDPDNIRAILEESAKTSSLEALQIVDPDVSLTVECSW